MHTPNPHEHESHNKAASVREGYEVTDVSVHGIMVFLIGLFISVGVFFVFCFGMGKVINNALEKRDGPANQWNQGSAEAGKTYHMQSNPAMEQQQLQQLTRELPNASSAGRRRQPGHSRPARPRRPAARQLQLGRPLERDGPYPD